MRLRRLWQAGAMVSGATLALAGAAVSTAASTGAACWGSSPSAAGRTPAEPAVLRPAPLTAADPRPAASETGLAWPRSSAPLAAIGTRRPAARCADRSRRAVSRPRIRSPDRGAGLPCPVTACAVR